MLVFMTSIIDEIADILCVLVDVIRHIIRDYNSDTEIVKKFAQYRAWFMPLYITESGVIFKQ